MSYKQLSVYLKPCFLYMGVFSEDEVIRASRLIKLWVAEGFLKGVGGKSMEEIAREYLEELISRNLILIDELGSTGNIKFCKVHDLLKELCLREAQKERFYATNPQGQHRFVRSWVSKLEYPRLPPLNLKLLRVLDSTISQGSPSAEFLEKVHRLVNSRFLRISTIPEWEFPCSIWLFRNLQTLFVYTFYGGLDVTVPTDFWYLSCISHVHVQYLYLPDPPNGQDDLVLRNLQTLGIIVNFKCREQVLKRIPNIKKLRIRYDEGLEDDRYCLTNLDHLDKLEYLSCEILGSYIWSLINFPHSLKKLTLDVRFSQCWEGVLDKIGELPLLQKLQLYYGTFKEGQWETTEGQFRSLKFLHLHYCGGPQIWRTESSHFPCLDHLILDHVRELEEIPLDIAEISTLRVLEVDWCKDSVVVSAKRILEEQEELYGEEAALQVRVHLLRKNEALECLAGPNFHVISY